MQLRAGEHVLLSSLPPFWTQVGGHRRPHVSSEVKLSLAEFRIYSDDKDRAVGEKTSRQVFGEFSFVFLSSLCGLTR